MDHVNTYSNDFESAPILMLFKIFIPVEKVPCCHIVAYVSILYTLPLKSFYHSRTTNQQKNAKEWRKEKNPQCECGKMWLSL